MRGSNKKRTGAARAPALSSVTRALPRCAPLRRVLSHRSPAPLPPTRSAPHALTARRPLHDPRYPPPAPPRVDSAVVRMQPLPQVPAIAPALLGELVAVAFSQRRKLLRHTLGRWLEQRGFAGSFNVQRRAEEVPVAEYLQLAEALSA